MYLRKRRIKSKWSPGLDSFQKNFLSFGFIPKNERFCKKMFSLLCGAQRFSRIINFEDDIGCSLLMHTVGNYKRMF